MGGLCTVAPVAKMQFFTNGGVVAAGYQLFIYEAGTSTKATSYSETYAVPGSENPNPIVLDSAGRASIFLPSGSFKFVFASPTDTDPPTSPIWTVDNIQSVAGSNVNQDVEGIAGEDLAFGVCVICSDGFGSRTAGRWYKADASDVETSTNIVMAGFVVSGIDTGNTGSIRIVGRLSGFSSLTTGSNYFMSETAGEITTTAPAHRRCVGFADSDTSLLIAPFAQSFLP